MTGPLCLDSILPLVRKPGQYIGGELHAAAPELRPEQLNVCLIFPDLYEIGMAHQGLQILYHRLNAESWARAHRAFAPEPDMEAALRAQDTPLFSLEARAPLHCYDMLGITLPYELCYGNILTVLQLGRIPLRSKDRGQAHPLIIGGGSCAFNPEPVADFFDAIVLGDGEEVIITLSKLLHEAKQAALPRALALEKLADIEGVYAPGFFLPRYNQQGELEAIDALKPGRSKVRRCVLPELDDGALLRRPLVPVVRPVHDRLSIEIARGCSRGCRFCQAGMLYRPVRERRMEDILALAEAGIAEAGYEEMALLSLSTGDYSCLEDLVSALMNRFSAEQVSVSMPSMRVGTLSAGIMEQIKRVRKTGFTVAPEAGSERLRRVINKGILEQDLLETCANAFHLGWKLIKLYFMIGLPGEREEDLEAIAHLTRKAKAQAPKSGRVQINLGLGVFVPKAHTPFQWEAQLDLDEAKRRIGRLKQLLPAKGFQIKWQDPEQSLLEGVLARGDRRLSAVIEAAWNKGARLDSWSEYFNLQRWRQAALENGLELEQYLLARPLDAVLPWDHLDCGVDRAFLVAERRAAEQEQFTPDCRGGDCQGCGLCDFDQVQPRLQVNPGLVEVKEQPAANSRSGKAGKSFRYRAQYSRSGDARFYGHLELLQLVFRALRRARLPLLFSEGFNPTPRIAFSQALSVGMESLAEHFDMELASPLTRVVDTMARINAELPPGVELLRIEPTGGKNPSSSLARYEVRGLGLSNTRIEERIHQFLQAAQVPFSRVRKNRRTDVDLRPLVHGLSVQDGVLILDLIHHQGLPGASPRDILEMGLGYSRQQALLARIIKTSTQAYAALS